MCSIYFDTLYVVVYIACPLCYAMFPTQLILAEHIIMVFPAASRRCQKTDYFQYPIKLVFLWVCLN